MPDPEITNPEKPRQGNRRKTGKKMRGIVAVQIPWKDDPIILDRIRVGMVPWMEQRSKPECLKFVNDYLAEKWPSEPPISLETLDNDRNRARSLGNQDVEQAKSEHLLEANYALAGSWDDLDWLRKNGKRTNPNLAALTNAILNGIKLKGQFDGSLKAGETPSTTVNIDHIDIVVQELRALSTNPVEVKAAIDRAKSIQG